MKETMYKLRFYEKPPAETNGDVVLRRRYKGCVDKDGVIQPKLKVADAPLLTKEEVVRFTGVEYEDLLTSDVWELKYFNEDYDNLIKQMKEEIKRKKMFVDKKRFTIDGVGTFQLGYETVYTVWNWDECSNQIVDTYEEAFDIWNNTIDDIEVQETPKFILDIVEVQDERFKDVSLGKSFEISSEINRVKAIFEEKIRRALDYDNPYVRTYP